MYDNIKFFIIFEINSKLRTSPLLWCYYSSVIAFFIPQILLIMIYHTNTLDINVIHTLILLQLLFTPISIDIINRESHFSITEIFSLRILTPKRFFSLRLIANVILILTPIILGNLIYLILLRIPILDLIFLISNILLVVWIWYLISLMILLTLEFRFHDLFSCFCLYYAIIFMIFSSFNFLDLNFLLNNLDNIFILKVQDFMIQYLLVLMMLVIFCLGITFVFFRLIFRKIEAIYPHNLPNKQEDIQKQTIITLQSNILTRSVYNRKKLIKVLYCLLTFTIYYICNFAVVEFNKKVEIAFFILTIQFILILIVIFLKIYPQVLIEKEYNMEELILSKISAVQYFKLKINKLFGSFFFLFIFPCIIILLLLSPYFFEVINGKFLYFIILEVVQILLIRGIYFISILAFLWRYLSVKDILRSSMLTVLGLELLGALFYQFLVPISINQTPLKLSPILSPILSIPNLSIQIFDINSWPLLLTSLWVCIAISLTLFLFSIALTINEIKYY